MTEIHRPLRDRDGECREGRSCGGATLPGAAATSFNREFHVNSYDFTERLARFQDPHAASRQEILGIKARAAAQRAEIDGSMRRFENGVVAFTGLFLLYVVAHLGWAWHRGLLTGLL